MKVAICVPCYGDPKYRFVVKLLALHKSAILSGADVNILTIQHTLVDLARQHVAGEALKGGADYLLWLDADMSFPSDTLSRLISHDLPVVAANYRMRNFRKKISTAHVRQGDLYTPIRPKPEGLEQVDTVGLGVCLMKAEVFSELPKPWFACPDGGEDTFFFRRLAEVKGVRPVVDHALSAEVGHIAEAALMF